MCTLLYTPLLHIRDYDQRITETSSFHICCRSVLAAAASTCVVRLFGTNFHRICKAQTLGNSLSVALSAGYLSVHTAGGASDRHWLKACSINGLNYSVTYLLTYLHGVGMQATQVDGQRHTDTQARLDGFQYCKACLPSCALSYRRKMKTSN